MELSVADAEEYTQALEQVGDGWFRQIAIGVKLGIPDALGLSRKQWSDRIGIALRSAAERREAVSELDAEGLSNRAIADVLGVDERTVRRDLELDAANAAPEVEDNTNPQVIEPDLELDAANAAPEVEDNTTESEPDEAEEPAEQEDSDEELLEPKPAPLQPLRRGWHELGPHRLYCGDSTDGEFVVACEGAALAFADPPYNAGKAEWDQDFEWKHDYLAESAEIVAVTPGIAALAGFLAKTEMPYKWSMAAEITNGMTSGALRFGNWICVTLFAHGSIYRKSKDHVRIPAATGDDAGGSHASRKPIRLLTHLIELFTTKGDTVIDPFLGSGTTLIAADRTGRQCIGAEIDPMHCAEIVARYNEQASSA